MHAIYRPRNPFESIIIASCIRDESIQLELIDLFSFRGELALTTVLGVTDGD